ncbi:P-loop containing nucleoside triphosphate hydrolase protein [Dendryphion nanum]|uniref:P-loop containing nucleoside triphosphate hydrolase protein n=1 Tax=Dendryphion nanum TaxID=256645 RepID=A0A9P9D5C0_9PLEO|nr:P-loop containing nucleoside triphosphate hydrolase protein [Dendryphion nanum]
MGRHHRKQRGHVESSGSRNRTPAIHTHNTFATLGAEEPDFDEMNPFEVNHSHPPTPQPSDDIQQYFKDAEVKGVGGPWLQKPEIPTASEFLSEQVSSGTADIIGVTELLRPNKLEGAYESNEEYLGTQYELVREDVVRPLREAIAQIRVAPYLNEAEYGGGSIGVYEPVYITSLIFSPRGLATRVAFSLGRVKKHIRWSQSKRLITGSLVALSPAEDNFKKQIILATVAARTASALNQNPPEIDLFFARSEELEIDPMKKYIMVENRSSFFEASRHTMLAIQKMVREPFPLAKHIVQTQKDVDPPAYVQSKPRTDMSSVVTLEEYDTFRNVDILNEWPSSDSHGLDKSQSEALRRILTKQLAIIQGPPGTGKTYVSVIALKILLANLSREDPPIIVTCQTNHALDQLLRHIAEFEPSFIRLGGRSKDTDVIKKRTLYEVRVSVSRPKTPRSLKTQAMSHMRKLTTEMQMLLAPLEANKPPLDHRTLISLGLLTEEQAASLDINIRHIDPGIAREPSAQIENWISKSLETCLRPLQPEDYGMEFEEETFEIEQLGELEAEALARDEDIEQLKGPMFLLSDNYTARGNYLTDGDIQTVLDTTDDLITIPPADRGSIYTYLQRQVKQRILVEFRKIAKRYELAVTDRRIGQWEQDLIILGDQRLIGMTTTGLSKYRPLISALRPKIVLVEEAAETLEAPITVSCLPTLEHMILVGDHQQLRPHCQIRDLEELNFNISLFERMVQNDIEFACLLRQRRMVPEIRRLLEPIYGNALRDHPTVKDSKNRPDVEGMGGTNSFFFTHEWKESRDANQSSLNEKEADMVVGLFNHLYLNGVDPNKITVLTFYNGQRKTLMIKLKEQANLRAIARLNVVTVDSYQGEENDIVILSLVRSNAKRKIGFLAVDNRVCVALSRAKRGFYIFGNAEMLAVQSDTWAQVVDIMYGKTKPKGNPKQGQKRRLGYFFPIECAHHKNKLFIQEPDDWSLINGGCDNDCRCILPCGHICTLRCHPFSSSLINCTQKCNKVLECNHVCSTICCEPCVCQRCRQQVGTRGLLKQVRASTMGITHNPVKRSVQNRPTDATNQLAQQTAHLAIDAASENTAVATPIGTSHGSIDGWKEYSSGGAGDEDGTSIQRLKDNIEQSQDLLIEISPVKTSTATPQRTGNLIDLDGDDNLEFNSPPTARQVYRDSITYSSAAQGTRDSNMNLLD